MTAPMDPPAPDAPEPDDEAETREPGSPGVDGEDPTRFAESIGPLDEAPDGMTPSDTTNSSADSLPPGSG